jgi:hypothetical protein
VHPVVDIVDPVAKRGERSRVILTAVAHGTGASVMPA